MRHERRLDERRLDQLLEHRACHFEIFILLANLGSTFNGQVAAHTQGKADSIGSMELSDVAARIKAMDEEDIAIQVIYTTLFLAYPLTKNVGLGSAITTSYNRWMGDRLARHPRIKWSAVVNLDDVAAAMDQVHEAKKLGAVSVMVLGTAGDDMLDHPRLFPFYQALCEENLALGVANRDLPIKGEVRRLLIFFGAVD